MLEKSGVPFPQGQTVSEGAERFVRLFAASERGLRVFVRRLVPAQSDADDVMQEVAVVLWRKFGEFRPECDFLAWARGIARFEVLAWRRDKARDREWLSGELIEILSAESIEMESPLARQRESFAACLDRLATPQRDLLLAAYRPNTRIQDVASRSGRTVGGFYQWLHRMRKRLLDCVRAEMTKPVPGSGVDLG